MICVVMAVGGVVAVDRETTELAGPRSVWDGAFCHWGGDGVGKRRATQRKERKQMNTLECNYSKKLGLPGYSSHQFSITLRTELGDLGQVQAESARLYRLLQEGVDTSIRQIGYLPSVNGNGNGNGHSPNPSNSNGHSPFPVRQANGHGNGNSAGNGHPRPVESGGWQCSPRQQELIQKIVEEHRMDRNDVEGLAQERFGKGVKALNKLEASGLIEELLEMTGQSRGTGRARFHTAQKAGAR